MPVSRSASANEPSIAARRVTDAVRTETGLTCSVGLGPNKLGAKVASDAEKPDGFVELTDEATLARMWDSAEALPSMPELEEPRLWLARSA